MRRFSSASATRKATKCFEPSLTAQPAYNGQDKDLRSRVAVARKVAKEAQTARDRRKRKGGDDRRTRVQPRQRGGSMPPHLPQQSGAAPAVSETASRQPPHCFSCGLKGHYARDCSKHKRAEA